MPRFESAEREDYDDRDSTVGSRSVTRFCGSVTCSEESYIDRDRRLPAMEAESDA